ncbi:MAG: protein kinase domain-containing protein [Phycisphaerales bacterium]
MDWGRVKDVFGEVLDADEVARAAVLDRACEGDIALRSQVESLLSAHGGGGVFDEPIGLERVGPFDLGAELGRGAFGIVRLGVQHRPVHREVAVKFLHVGADAAGVLARFTGEQETLAHLDHPGIARLIECGSDERGRPWFAMELVRGQPITRVSEDRKLNVRQRVELMVQVCRAVQHAHQRGVIHRDIKPSNIIVGEDENGAQRAKVIDFGIAKALATGAGALSPMLTLTREHQLIGTPAYMSPEQAAGAAIETTSDVYALGAVLYELLMGRPPVDAGTISRAAPGELSNVIRASDPGRVSAHANIGDASERGLLRELDWVVLGALEKDASKRIHSAGELADELTAVLEGRPTRSGPPGARVRVRAFIRRHPLGAALIAGLALLAIGVTTGSVIGLVEARREEAKAQKQARRAEAARAFVLDDALGSLATGLEHGRDPSVVELLDAASANLDKRFADDPVLKVEVLKQLTRGYLRVFKYDRVLKLSQVGWELSQTLDKPDYESAVEFGTLNADVSARLGRHAEQIDWVTRSAKLAREHLPPESPAALSAEAGDALISSIRGDGQNARARLENVVKLAEGRPEALHALKLALTYLYVQAEIALDPEQAVHWAALRLQAAEKGTRTPGEVVDSAAVLLRHLILLGRNEEADAIFHRIMDNQAQPRATPGMVAMLRQGARLEMIKGRNEQAAKYAQQSYDMATKDLGMREDETVDTLEVLAEVETALGNADKAVDWMTRSRNAVETNMGPSSREARWTSLGLARVEHKAGLLQACDASIAKALRGVPEDRARATRDALVALIVRFNAYTPHTKAPAGLVGELDAAIDLLDADWGRDRAAQVAALAFASDVARGTGELERAARTRAAMLRIAAGR